MTQQRDSERKKDIKREREREVEMSSRREKTSGGGIKIEASEKTD